VKFNIAEILVVVSVVVYCCGDNGCGDFGDDCGDAAETVEHIGLRTNTCNTL